MPASVQVQETIAKLVPGGERSLSHLSDDELLTSTRRLVGASNKLFAQLLLHLAEVETRGIHRTRACSSLYTYCIYELRMSEDAAARRSSAARLVKRFPLLFDAIARGELHLTGLLMLGPHLTPENHVEVLARSKFRTKKELAKLVRELNPLPLVPDLMEPLRPEPPRSLREPTWEDWVTSLCPPVRALKPGESPRDWANDTVDGASANGGAVANGGASANGGDSRKGAGEVADGHDAVGGGGANDAAESPDATETFTAPARCDLAPITAPQQYQMQFSTTEEHVQLVERARALLARSSPGVSLGELHRQAMQLLVARLEKEKFAVAERSPKAKPPLVGKRARPQPTPHGASAHATPTGPTKKESQRRSSDGPETSKAAPRRRGADVPASTGPAPCQRGGELVASPGSAPRRRVVS